MRALERTRTGRPKLRRTDDVLDYWAERIGEIAPAHESFHYSSMICRGDSLFHYGSHFELARIMRDARGRTRLVLLNGDSYEGASGFGPSTSSRQSDTRSAVQRSGAPYLVVPFSALEGAGIDFSSIRPIHVRDDRWTIEEHSSRTRPAKLTKMEDPSGATHPETWYDYRERCDVTRHVPNLVDNPRQTVPFSARHGWCENGAHLGDDGVWRWQVRRHWLGDSIFRARYTEHRTRKATPEEIAQDAAHRASMAEIERLRALQRQTHANVYKLDSRYGFGGDYRRMARSMFAAEGFRQRADALESAIYDVPKVAANRVRNGRVPITVTKWATFLSSFDYQEPRPLYFLCELPYGAKPNTVDEAIEALKPPEVVAALARGLNVVRQGDLFAIPTKLTTRQIRRMRTSEFAKGLRVLGTNHSVTEGVVLRGGAVLGRGIMRHEPERWRPPDHVRQKLGDGKTWHLLVRNTVPRSR
jgi:hypothetical protein